MLAQSGGVSIPRDPPRGHPPGWRLQPDPEPWTVALNPGPEPWLWTLALTLNPGPESWPWILALNPGLRPCSVSLNPAP